MSGLFPTPSPPETQPRLEAPREAFLWEARGALDGKTMQQIIGKLWQAKYLRVSSS